MLHYTVPPSVTIESFWLKSKGAQEVKRMNTLVDQLDGYRIEEIENRSSRYLGAAPGRGRPRAIYT